MKLKKLVLMGLVCCTVFASKGMAVFAEGADAQVLEEVQTEQDATVPESGADEADGSEQELDGAAMEELADEVVNLMSVLESSITSSVSATIENEQAKLPKYTQEELMYLACIIYCEAGNQEKKGKIAVANVIMNRVESDIFDHVTTIKEAIYDCERWGRQFSPVYVKSNGKWTTKGSNYEKVLTMYQTGNYDKEWQKEQMEGCIAAAKEALEGKKVIDESYLYFNMGISSTKAKCNNKGASYTVIGCHIFY
ncbi:MAG: cell wall hydrolase [Lachnospiraceae bacterium]|nr:cell wall hydrolase [Lachnospiraceae bacterium]